MLAAAMLRRLALLYAALVVMGAARTMWGPPGEGIAAGGLVLIGAVAGLLVWRRERQLRRHVAQLPLEEQLKALEADPEVRDAAAGLVFGNERRDRVWQITRWLGPWLAILYLPLLYAIVARPDPNGIVLIALGCLGVLAWRQWLRHYVGRYRCPGCGARIPAVSLRPVRFVCLGCATTWRL
jgi:hypothetical protein